MDTWGVVSWEARSDYYWLKLFPPRSSETQDW